MYLFGVILYSKLQGPKDETQVSLISFLWSLHSII